MFRSRHSPPSTYLIDLDGVVYQDGYLIQGVAAALRLLSEQQKSYYFVTNNSAASRASLHHKLISLGLACEPDQVLASGFLLGDYIAAHLEYRQRSLYFIGSQELRSYFLSLGLTLTDQAPADIVVVCLDFDFNFCQLEIASAALQQQALFFVANLDASFPSQLGYRRPGLGAIVQAIMTAAGRLPDLIFGKPNPLMLSLLGTTLIPEATVVVGDSPESDIEFARQLGTRSVLIDPDSPPITTDHPLHHDLVLPDLLSAVRYLEKM